MKAGMKNEENRTRKALRNILWNYGNQFLTLLLSFASRTVFIWTFGVEYLGLNGIFSDVLGMLSLTDLGLNSAMVYSFYAPLAHRDRTKLAALVGFYRKIYLGIALGVFLLGLCLIPVLPHLLHTERAIPHLTLYYLFALANVASSYLFVYKTSMLTADQKGYIFTRVSMLVNMAKVLAQVVCMLVFANYVLYLALDLAGNLLTNAVASWQTGRLYPFLRERAVLAEKDRMEIWRTIFSGSVYKISSVLLNATDNILISVLVSTAAVGIYSNYLLIQTKATMLYSILFTSITASIGNLIVQAAAKERFQVFRVEQMVSSLICLIFIPEYVLLVDDFIGLWLGDAYILPKAVVFAIGLNMYLSCILQPLWSYREATGLYRRTKYMMLLCAFLNLLLSVWLGLRWGIFGILLASGLSRLLTYVWYEPYLLFESYFGARPTRYYLGLARDFVLIALWSAVLYGILSAFAVQSWIAWGAKAAAVLVLSAAFSLAVHRRVSDFHLLTNRFRAILASKKAGER